MIFVVSGLLLKCLIIQIIRTELMSFQHFPFLDDVEIKFLTIENVIWIS